MFLRALETVMVNLFNQKVAERDHHKVKKLTNEFID
jgi:hypothetical protein